MLSSIDTIAQRRVRDPGSNPGREAKTGEHPYQPELIAQPVSKNISAREQQATDYRG